MIETTVSQRKGLEAERQQKETEGQRKARQVSGGDPAMFVMMVLNGSLTGACRAEGSRRGRNIVCAPCLLL